METLRSYWTIPEAVAVPTIPNPPYISVWGIEQSVELYTWTKFFAANQSTALAASIIYIVTIFAIRDLMVTRPPFQLRRGLVLWNAGLAVFSILGFFRMLPQIQYELGKPGGTYNLICRADLNNYATVFWGGLFGLSKLAELGDTYFIVLRKRPLMFLHYYHHVTVLNYIWFTAHAMNSSGLIFVFMNYGVHSLMYSYYALKALQIKIPKRVSLMITLLQLSQMVAGIGVNSYVLFAKAEGRRCDTRSTHVYYAFLMYASYFVLFANFFYAAYVQKRKRIKKSQ